MANIVSADGRDAAEHEALPERALLRAHFDGLFVPGVLGVAVQPIVRLADRSVAGYEALVRIPFRPLRPPDWWLERAGELGVRPRLEIAAWRAIAQCGPPPEEALLFINASPALLAEPDLFALRDLLPERLVIEVTEQEAVADYMRLREDLEPWLTSKARLAIDDTGAGHSSLRHVIELCPDFLKIDASLVSNVDHDRNRRALVRSLVAFAREVGCTVIAEGVETVGELDVLRDAEVDLAQGFLLGRPVRPWRRTEAPPDATATREHSALGLARLSVRLARAIDARSACEATAEYLFRRGDLMPSVYLERGDHLRCVAQRGLWQVLDGLGPRSGITGRTWADGEATYVADVTTSTDYLEAIPGVRSEACVPILREGRSVGALNVESLSPIGPGTLSLLTRCAELLSERLTQVGWGATTSNWQRAAQASVTMSELALEGDPAAAGLRALCDAGGLDSGALIDRATEELAVRQATGPLAEVLEQVPVVELERLSSLVDGMSACYTAGDGTGRGFVGTESLRSFARAVAVLPLRFGGRQLGTVVLASSTPRALTGEDVEPLELLVGQFAATLSASSLVEQLRRQARQDHLTGLGNRSAFEQRLDSATDNRGRTLAGILDIDHFKTINDSRGHLVGDEVLRELAARLREVFSEISLYRYGGDEFVLVLDDTDPRAAAELADGLCATAREVLSAHGSSLTAGFASGEIGESARDVFARADDALLWAKRYSRGVAVFAPAGRGRRRRRAA